ncbi:MAG: hypothetical protein PWQ70_2895 [Clostridiales bacterium]|jgi:hypothetical protein|nr:hypothetical protein [Clostridiales bacterium]
MLIYLAILLIGILVIYNNFRSNKKEEGFSNVLFTAGIDLVLSSFETWLDLILPCIALVNGRLTRHDIKNIINASPKVDYIQLIIGIILIIGGIGLRHYSKNKLYILNINGYFDKRVENSRQELNLGDFEFKEREIDFIRIYNKAVQNCTLKYVAEDIVDEIKQKITSFKDESKNFKRGYTGIAPIPFIMLAGTFFKREKIDEYFEYDKKETHKYYRLTNAKRFFKKNKYPILRSNTNIDNLYKQITEVVLAISITNRITTSDLSQFNGKAVVGLSVDNPDDNIIRYKEQLIEYVKIIQNIIKELKDKLPMIKKIHLVYAGQSCLAFELGKIIDDQQMPQIINYHYYNQGQYKYPWGIIMNGNYTGKYVEHI